MSRGAARLREGAADLYRRRRRFGPSRAADGAGMRIDDRDLGAISRLWRELAEFPASAAASARSYCLARLAEIIGADNAFWVAAARTRPQSEAADPLRGWRPRVWDRLHSDAAYDRRLADVARDLDAGAVDPLTLANAAHIGENRAFLRAELVEDQVWERCAMLNETMRPSGLEDRLIGVHALNPRQEAHIGLDRGRRAGPFGERERDLLRLFMLGAPAFHREQFLAHGLLPSPLTPRERDVLRLLLTDLSEREIGDALGLTWRTTHQYAGAIYGKFGVRGRLGLMALWLRHGADPAM